MLFVSEIFLTTLKNDIMIGLKYAKKKIETSLPLLIRGLINIPKAFPSGLNHGGVLKGGLHKGYGADPMMDCHV